MNKDKFHAVFILIVLSLIWGSSFILIKKSLVGYTPFEVGALRVFIASLVFLPYSIKNIRKIELKTFKFILIFALLEVGIPPFLYSYAQTVVNSSTAGILNSLVPLFTLLIGFIVYKVNTNFFKVIGVLIGLLGAILIVFFKTGDMTKLDFTNSWGLLIVLATFMYGFGTNIIKENLHDIPDIQISAIGFFSMGIPAFLYLLTTDVVEKTINNPEALHSLGSIILLSVFGSAFAILLFAKLVHKSNALFASFVTYLIPFIAILWGIIDGEGISLIQVLSLAIILSGIYLANLGIKKEK